MISEIDHILAISTDNSNSSSFIGVADSSADGSFLVHYFLSSNLKKGNSVCFIGFAQSFNHYSIVAQKHGINLKLEKSNRKLIFIEGMKYLGQAICHQALGSPVTDIKDTFYSLAKYCNLLPLLQNIKSQLSTMFVEASDKQKVLVIDNLSMLLNIGVSPKDMVTFLHYLRDALLNDDHPGSVIVFLNVPKTDDDSMFLWRYLCHSCSTTLFVSGLASGYCKDVHGELTIKYSDEHHKPRPATSKTVQFKVMEKNVSFFAAGIPRSNHPLHDSSARTIQGHHMYSLSLLHGYWQRMRSTHYHNFETLVMEGLQ